MRTIGTWNIICDCCIMDYLTFKEMNTTFIEKDGVVFYLYDEQDKIEDISKMPSYITEDWIIYNKKHIDLDIIDEYIKEFSESGLLDDVVNNLKSIRRDYQINRII